MDKNTFVITPEIKQKLEAAKESPLMGFIFAILSILINIYFMFMLTMLIFTNKDLTP